MPSTPTQASTRSKHQNNWAVVITWAVALNIAHLILTMHTDTLKALTWELLYRPPARGRSGAHRL